MKFKRIAVAAVAVLAVLAAVAWGYSTHNRADVSHAVIDCGTSELFTEAEIQEGAEVIRQDFSHILKGCDLQRITYGTDELTMAWQEDYVGRVMEFTVDYIDEDGEPTQWSWTLEHQKDGSWKSVNYGFS